MTTGVSVRKRVRKSPLDDIRSNPTIVLYGSSNNVIEDATTVAEIAVQSFTLIIHKNPKMASGFLLTN